MKLRADPDFRAYPRAVVRGERPACATHVAACRRHLDDLAGGDRRGLRFDRQAAAKAVSFFPRFLRHSKGEWSGQPFELTDWQAWIVASLFGWKRRDGTRRFRQAYLELPRKNGKSTLVAGVGLYLLVADNEPGAEVYAAATKLDQAKIIWEEAAKMVAASPALRGRVKRSTDNLSVTKTQSKFEPLGGDPKTHDGLNVSGALIDELHAHPTRLMLDVLETATGSRRQPLVFSITTAGHDRISICREQHDYTERVVTGVIEDDSFFGLICSIDESDDWREESSWRKANPNFGVSVKPDDLARGAAKAVELPSAQNTYLRLRLNVWTEQAQRWIPLARWDMCADVFSLDDLEGADCWAGLDLASTSDVAAFVALFRDRERAGRLLVAPKFWIPAESAEARLRRDKVPYPSWIARGLIAATPGDAIDFDRIRRDVAAFAERHHMRKLAIDRWNAAQIATQLAGDGIEVVMFGQGFASMSGPSKELERRLLAGELAHAGNEVLRWMASNVAIERDAAENLKPSKKHSAEKIDGIVSLVMALGVYLADPGDASPYDDRGIVTV